MTPSPALQPALQGHITPSWRPFSLRLGGGTSRALLGARGAAPWPPGCHFSTTPAALPARPPGSTLGRTRVLLRPPSPPRLPGGASAVMPLECGRGGPRVLGKLRARPRARADRPRPDWLAAGQGSGKQDTVVSQLRARRACATHRPRARKAAAASRAPSRARAAPCPGDPRGGPGVAGPPRR